MTDLLELRLGSAIRDGQAVTPEGWRTSGKLRGVSQRRASTHVHS